MPIKSDRSYLLPAFCLAILFIHWLNQWIGTYGLNFDEAQYWFWGKHPAWGYYSKPPVIAWLMGLSTALFGDSNFGVKMLSPVILLTTGFVLYAAARRLDYPPRIAAWVMATYITLPVVTSSAMFFATDVPLQLCWAVALYSVVIALREHKPRYWLLVGAAAGLGLLSKYTMIGFGASCLLALLALPQYRPQLRSVWPWAGALLAALLLAPNLAWNAHHHFVTLSHTNDNVFSKSIQVYPEDMLQFMLAQFAVFGPILLVALLLSLRGMTRNDTRALLHCFVWPLAIAGMLVSLLAGAQAHWIMPVYLAGALIVVPWLYQRSALWLKLSLALHVMVLLLFYALPSLHFKHDPMARLFVWNDLAMQVRPLIEAYPNAVVMTNERKIAAAFTYQLRALRGNDEPVYKWNPSGRIGDHYDLLTQEKDFTNRQRLLVMRESGLDREKPTPNAKLLQLITLRKYRFGIYLVPIGTHDPS